MAKPKLALVPAAQGSKFYSVLPSSGVGDFDFTRSGSATRINSQGLIETVGNGVSRLNYPMIDGKVVGCPHHILEPSRSNDLQRSQEFDNAYWTKYQTSVSANSSISPDGTLNADKLIEDNSNSTHQTGRAISYNAGTTYTASVFAKSSNRNLQISAGNTGTFPANAIFDLNNGVILSETLGSASIQKFDNGWYRCIVTATALATATTNINFGLTNGSNLSYTGDGNSFVELYGAMREQSSYPTSYIKTTNSSTTRSAETANNSGDASTFNSSEGVLYIEMKSDFNDAATKRISISDFTNNNRLTLYFNVSTNLVGTVIVTALGGSPSSLSYVVPSFSTYNKIALKYKTNDYALWVNGVEVDIELTGNTFAPNLLKTIRFEQGAGGLHYFYGNTKQIQYFDSVLNDSDLEKLTSWVSFSDMANGQLYTIE
ncbi:hypothetical protein N9D22_06650 [Flavobacteriaceae bacterium]|nr:hypothetical protein [Flavobacteriaceae bacterium]